MEDQKENRKGQKNQILFDIIRNLKLQIIPNIPNFHSYEIDLDYLDDINDDNIFQKLKYIMMLNTLDKKNFIEYYDVITVYIFACYFSKIIIGYDRFNILTQNKIDEFSDVIDISFCNRQEKGIPKLEDILTNEEVKNDLFNY